MALVGTLVVSSNPDGANIWVDGKQIGKTSLDDSIYVEPGGHTVEAKLAGYKDDTKTLQAAQGERQKVFFGLTQAGETLVPELPPKSRPVWPYVAFGGLAAAGLGVGITFMVLAAGKNGDADNIATTLKNEGGSCGAAPPPAFAARCEELDGLASDKKTFQQVGVAGFIAGGVGVVGLIAYAAWPREKKPSTTGGLSWTPRAAVGPRAASVSVSGSF